MPKDIPAIFCDDVSLLAEYIYRTNADTSRVYQAARRVIEVAKLGASDEISLEACDRALEVLQ